MFKEYLVGASSLLALFLLALPADAQRARDRIDAAKADWKAKRFGGVPGDAEEFIPLPE